MKILITTDLFTTQTNGVVTSVKNLREELVKKGHDVRILTLSDNMHSKQEDDVYYIRSVPLGVYPNVRMPMTYRHRLIREMVEWKPDVIHSQCEFFSLQFALYISKKTGAPIVHTYHTMWEDYTHYVTHGKKYLDITYSGDIDATATKTDNTVYLHITNTSMTSAQRVSVDLGGANGAVNPPKNAKIL